MTRASGAARLLALADPKRADEESWSDRDLEAILRHLFDTPLASEPGLAAGGGAARTVGEVLFNPAPTAESLALLKEHAKAALKQGSGVLPEPVARVLYVTTILRSRGAGIGSLSSLDDATLSREARRCLTLPWLTASVRNLLARVNQG